ncbi:MAG TPA: hypothetical protein VFN10_02805 [Thermoanaerobaculia bacterium]|nr:hypothetical protein [Thermoanaerobaculia bacterium]
MDTSSVVIRAIDARTFTQMESFVKDLESRPIDRLLRDLPELAKLSDTKVSLVSYVLAGKYRASETNDKHKIKDSMTGWIAAVTDDEVRERISAMLERLR